VLEKCVCSMKEKKNSEEEVQWILEAFLLNLPSTSCGTWPEIGKSGRLRAVTQFPVHVTPVQLQGSTSVSTQFASRL